MGSEKRYYFVLRQIPDFTLSKYQSLNLSDFGRVSGNNLVFLKQLHSLGLVGNMDFHLFFSYVPKLEYGEGLEIFLMCCTNSNSEIVKDENIKNILSSFAQHSCFELELCKSDDSSVQKKNVPQKPRCVTDADCVYNAFSIISKKEYMTNPRYSATSANGVAYFSVSDWKPRKEARMYNTLKLLEQYAKPAMIRVDLFPIEDPNEIITEINKKNIYSKIQQLAAFRATNDGGVGMTMRDEAAGRAASFYDDYFKTMSASLQFNANICLLADTQEDCKLLGDVLSSETIENGLIDCDCEYDNGPFSFDYKMRFRGNYVEDDPFDNQRVSAMKKTFTSEEIAPFFSLPYLYPSEHIGIRKETDPSFDSDGLWLGETNNGGYKVIIPYKTFAKHAYICGVPGSGKTYSMKHIIHSLHIKKNPFLVFEPAKREYRELFCAGKQKIEKYGSFTDEERTDDIILFSPKTNSLFPLHINPFQIPVGVNVNEYISVLDTVFNGAFFLPQPTPMILRKAIIRAYKACGFHEFDVIEENETRKFPVMTDLYKSFEWIMSNDSSYKGETEGNIRGVLETRIGSLMMGDIGEVFNAGISSMRPDEWNKKSIIIELEALSNEHANFITLLIISLIRLDLRLHPNTPDGIELRHVIFFEEAHNLIGKQSEASAEGITNSKIASTAYIKDMLAEVRAYKEGIVIADQLPTAIAPEVLKNTSIKIAHRQMAADEREAIGSVMSADSYQLEKLSKFTGVDALVNYENNVSSKPFDMKVITRFEYNRDDPKTNELKEIKDDKFLAQKLSTTSWYYNNLYNTSIKRRIEVIEEAFTLFSNDEGYAELKSSFETIYERVQSGNSADKETQIMLRKVNKSCGEYYSSVDNIMESVLAVEKVLLILRENLIGDECLYEEQFNNTTHLKRLIDEKLILLRKMLELTTGFLAPIR